MSDNNKVEPPDVHLDESTLHTFKTLIDAFPEDQRNKFKESFNAIEDPAYKAEVIHNVILDAHPDLNQVPQVNRDMAQGASMGGPVGLGMGMMKGAIPQDIPSVVGKLTSALAGGVPQNLTRHPVISAMGGQPAAIMASAAGQPGTGKNFGGDPKTMSGQISGDALAAAAPALMMGGGNNAPEVTGAMVENPESQITRNLDKTVTEVLQPPKGDIQSYTDRGMRLPAVEQAGKVISKSKNYGELRDNINSTIESTMKQRNDLLSANNKEIPIDYTNPLKELIAKESSSGQANPRDLSIMNKVLENENKYLGIKPTEDITNTTPEPSNPIDVLSAQKRKEMLQDLTEKLLERRADGEKVITQPAKYQALDALRLGLKQSIEKAVPEVAPLNETYNGLREARWLASGQKALADKEIPQSLLQKIAGYFDTNPAGVAIKVATRENRNLGKITSNIEGLQSALKNVRKPK